VEHRFVIQQAWGTWRHYQKLIGQCDEQIQQQLARFDSKVDFNNRLSAKSCWRMARSAR
jgi:hypothetical protein